MRIAGKRIDNFSMFVGVGAFFLLCIIPKISDFVISFITSIRNKIGGVK